MSNASTLARLEIFGPEQHFDQFHKTSQVQPEKTLMLAVLLDAVECFQKYAPGFRRKPDRLFKYTEEWIFEDDHKWPFSFINICEALGIDAQYVRKGLFNWKESRHSQRRYLPATTSHRAVKRCA
jgi:hypothetical protein